MPGHASHKPCLNISMPKAVSNKYVWIYKTVDEKSTEIISLINSQEASSSWNSVYTNKKILCCYATKSETQEVFK